MSGPHHNVYPPGPYQAGQEWLAPTAPPEDRPRRRVLVDTDINAAIPPVEVLISLPGEVGPLEYITTDAGIKTIGVIGSLHEPYVILDETTPGPELFQA